VTDSADALDVIAAWRTSHRATVFLVESLPPAIWTQPLPANPRRSVRSLAAHLHNSRCRWIRALGARHGVAVPTAVDARTVRPAALARALERSSEGIVALIRLGAEHDGRVPQAAWQNFPTDLAHFLAYFVAHEAHHRGQLCMVARALGHRLLPEVTNGLWQWKRLSRAERSRSGRERPR
jgi:uncharacterized damage-inducible protein DinB